VSVHAFIQFKPATAAAALLQLLITGSNRQIDSLLTALHAQFRVLLAILGVLF